MRTRTNTPAILLTSALLVAGLSAAGGAVAAGLVTGAQIQNGTVTSGDIRNQTLKKKDLAPTTVAALEGNRGATGSPGVVRAYARVDGVNVTRQSGGITATNPGSGIFCLTVPGIPDAEAAPVASIDWSTSATGGGIQAFVEVNEPNCPGDTIGVRTFKRDFSSTGLGPILQYSNEPFFIHIP